MATPTTSQQSDKAKALGLAVSQIEKSFGKGAIMRMGTDGIDAHLGPDRKSVV